MLSLTFSKWRLVTRAWPVSCAPKPPVTCLRNSTRFFTDTHNSLRHRKKKYPFTPSAEQQAIADLCGTKNVLVSARPGSGKTATAEAIVAAHPDKRVVVLTYSKRLQLETFQRLRTYSNCKVFTFHAMAGLLFGTLVCDDSILAKQREKAFDRSKLPQWGPEPFDIIVLDEFQDCTENVFWLTNCFILANDQKTGGRSARLVVLGDERQSIYDFHGADDRYLTLAPELLGSLNPYPFARAQLSQSFRLSTQSVQFINDAFLGGESYITSSKPGTKPIVIRCHRWDSKALTKQLWTLIKRYGAKNTAVIVPAVCSHGLLRKRRPLQNVVNKLSEQYSIPIDVPHQDEVPQNDRVTAGKMCVSTIHQFKGSERDLVILFGLGSSFFNYFGRSLPDDRCPNLVYVALTRAVEQLVLVHFEEEKLMPFVSVEALHETAEIINVTRNRDRIEPPILQADPWNDEDLEAIVDSHLYIRAHLPLPEDEHIELPDIVVSDEAKRFYEAVSDLNGLVIVAAFEYDIAETLDTLGLKKSDAKTIPTLWSQQGVSWLCRKACDYEAEFSGYHPRKIQMKNHAFDWIGLDDLARARNRLHGELSERVENLRFEVEAEGGFTIDNQECRLVGRADIVGTLSNPDRNSV